MAREDLKPFNTRPKGEHKLISKRGGMSKSVKKSKGAKWRWVKERMKKESMTNKDMEWIVQQLEDPKAMSADILIFLEKMKDKVDNSQKVSFANAKINAAKFIHGEKHHNVNLNVDVEADEFHRRLLDKEDS